MKTLILISLLLGSLAHADNVGEYADEQCDAISIQMNQTANMSEYDKLSDQLADLDCDSLLPSDH